MFHFEYSALHINVNADFLFFLSGMALSLIREVRPRSIVTVVTYCTSYQVLLDRPHHDLL